MKLTFKAKRNIGLVVMTIALIVAIILIVYFVQKNDIDSRLKNGSIGQTVSTSQAEVCVNDRKISKDFSVVTANGDKVFLLVKVEITANKKLTLSSKDFEVKDGLNVTNAYSSDNGHSFAAEESEVVLKKGESATYDLVFEVDGNRVESYFLYALGARIDLGGTVVGGLGY
ncbi:MAG: DUF4352 domain-containing protein [Clostridia bacterium]|nr:DUF4352 domain-containing protein [Clostridia bacterium]MDE7328970.1 DUF4352 domain-containing protein [Clostridia bacterium]